MKLGIIILGFFATILAQPQQNEASLRPHCGTKDYPSEMIILCLDTEEDWIESNGLWHAWFGRPFLYANSSDELPEPLTGKFEGDGIFYNLARDEEEGEIGIAYHDQSQIRYPASMYIRYYTHITEETEQIVVAGPGVGSQDEINGDVLTPITSNFTWMEQMIEIDVDHFKFMHFGVNKFNPMEILLVEKLVVAIGFPDASMDVMAQLCPAGKNGEE